MSDLFALIEYEIQLFKSDGSLSIIMTVAAIGPHDAKIEATKMLQAGIDYANARLSGVLQGALLPFRPSSIFISRHLFILARAWGCWEQFWH